MKWFAVSREVGTVFKTASATSTSNMIICMPFIWNDIIWGTPSNGAYRVYYQDSLSGSGFYSYPDETVRVNNPYVNMVGIPDDYNGSHSYSVELPNSKIKGKWKFGTNFTRNMMAGAGIPINAFLIDADGIKTVINYIRSTTTSSGTTSGTHPSYSTNMVFGNIETGVEYTTATDLPSQLVNAIIDFGEVEQDIPAFMKSIIENCMEFVVEPSEPFSIIMKSERGIRLHTENKYCDRDIEVIPSFTVAEYDGTVVIN